MPIVDNCCGCATLLVGTEAICLYYLLLCTAVIGSVSSVVPLEIAGVEIGTASQMAAGAWALVGIPLAVGAGVAALYRIESHVSMFANWTWATLFLGGCWWMYFLTSGDICQTLVTQDVQRLGTAFVCGFADTFVVFWLFMFGVIHAYLSVILMSAAQEIKDAAHPSLMSYSTALHGESVPIVPGMKGKGGGPGGMGMPPGGPGFGYGGPPPGYTASYGANLGAGGMPPPGYGGGPPGGMPPGAMRSSFAPAPPQMGMR